MESLCVFFRICERRKSFVFATVASVLLVSACVSGFATPAYTASSVIQVNSPIASAAHGAFSAANYLQSEALALKVIGDLKLEPDHGSPRERRDAVSAFRAHMKVKVIPGAHQLEVNYTDRDPKLAAAVVNHLVDVFADDSVTITIGATNQASQWLKGELDDLRTQSETLQSKLVALQMTHEFVDPDLHGKPIIYSSTLARLQRSTVLLAQARMDCVLKASLAEVIKTGNSELIPRLSGSSIASAGSQSVRDSLVVVQHLLRRRAMLQTQIDRNSSQLSFSSPELVRDRASMEILQQSLKEETKRAAQRAQNDLAAASKAEQDLRAENEVDRAVALQLNDRSIEYVTLPAEAGQSRQLYQGLLKRLKNAGMVEVTYSSNLTVITRATPSSTYGNSQVPLYLGLGGGFGVFFGCCVAFLLDAGESRKKEEEEGWTLRINGASIPPIRGMNSAAFHRSARVSQPGRNGFALIQRKQPTLSRAVTKSGPGQVRQMGKLILLRPAAGGRTEIMR